VPKRWFSRLNEQLAICVSFTRFFNDKYEVLDLAASFCFHHPNKQRQAQETSLYIPLQGAATW